jgi:hypothetical protein
MYLYFSSDDNWNWQSFQWWLLAGRLTFDKDCGRWIKLWDMVWSIRAIPATATCP